MKHPNTKIKEKQELQPERGAFSDWNTCFSLIFVTFFRSLHYAILMFEELKVAWSWKKLLIIYSQNSIRKKVTFQHQWCYLNVAKVSGFWFAGRLENTVIKCTLGIALV